MRCPYCHHSDTKVLDKRDVDEQAVTRRRRECLKCAKRFTTYERLEAPSVMVVKKNGVRVPFDREKLKLGIMKACEKRPVPTEVIEQIITEIEHTIREEYPTEVNSKKIGEIVMRNLKKLDPVAYLRFASVYREFEDLTEFTRELEKFEKKRG